MHRTHAAVLLLSLLLGCGGAPAETDAGARADAARPDGGDAPDAPGVDVGPVLDADVGPTTYPTTPPVHVCDDATLLAGPTSAPAGAIVVNPGDDLAAATDAAPAGSTFYLTAGTHHLAPGMYSQVVPKDGNTYVGAPGAILDGNHDNLYAFGQHARGVTLRYFTIQNFGTPGSTNNEGTVNHDAGEDWTVEHMTIQNNSGAGLFVGSGNTLRYACLRDNGQYGFSAYSPDGVHDVVVDHNEISGNNTDDWETRMPGCGCTGGGKFWATTNATITDNYVHDNLSVGLWADTNNAVFDVRGNYFQGNHGVGLFYEISYNARFAYNTFERNGLVQGPTNPGFPTGAIYLSESGGDARVSATFSTLEIAHNHFVDNWSGVVLWENADRFCNSPANTSSGVCTLGGAATLDHCVAGMIEGAPYFDDCRWRTQNVSVHDNLFELDPAHAGTGCSADHACGLQGLFSNYGTYPDWSPYQGMVVEDAIVSTQGNTFAHNEYVGPWQFMVHDQGNTVTFAAWQAAPFHQDEGSTQR